MGLFESKKGISNLVATLILIAVAVVGGAFAYTTFRNQSQSATTSTNLQVQNLKVVDTTSGQYGSITVKNTGTQRLSNITGDIQADGSVEWTIGTLDPGQTGSADNNSLSLTAGKEYVVKITADSPANANAITKTMTVQVQS